MVHQPHVGIVNVIHSVETQNRFFEGSYSLVVPHRAECWFNRTCKSSEVARVDS